jgi:hypothetical protein
MDANDFLGPNASSFLNYKKLQEMGGQAVATIVTAQRYVDQASKAKLVVVFQSGAALALNKNNLKVVCDAYGAETDRWAGKQIKLTADAAVKHMGKQVGGVVVSIP